MSTGPSSFMLIFRETTPEVYAAMPAEQRREALRRWNAWCDDLAARDRVQHGHPLQPGGRVVTRSSTRPVVDGPFAEAKELVGGYLLLDAEGIEAATAVAETCPNLPYGMSVEVREVAPCCHLARSLGMSTMREAAGA